ncbi:MAG: cysteine--tRNA ligase [Anaerosomatales bacterium]|nr:cysteine--tRNA ligase [Anaerosomatales bacterium]
MAIRVYNTMSRTKEDFVPREPGKVAMYVCGPTVYNHIHVGNARTFLSFDVIRRYLMWRGYEVTFVQNITDVDDKIIKRAQEEGRSPAEIAETYTLAFRSAMDALGVLPPTRQPLATQTIPDMIAMVERLIESGHAYVVDGDVYFAVRSYPGYGELSGRDIDELEAGARVEVDERKQDPLDFALWKAAKPGEPHWPSPWGEGRPGWHLECSVMSERELGVPFDIHGGGSDLVFPHHENERAQSEAATGKQFVRYWMHGGMLQIDSEKMSKSLGNFLLLKDVLAKYPAAVIRMLMLQTHYRSPLDFSDARLDEAAAALERITNAVRNLEWAAETAGSGPGTSSDARCALADAVREARQRFEEAMDDDFNTAGALAAVFELGRKCNAFLAEHASTLAADDRAVLADAAAAIRELLGVLGIELQPAEREAEPSADVIGMARDLAGYSGSDPDEALRALLAAREAARAERNWEAADAVRDALGVLGYAIEDTPQGPRVVRRGGDWG